MAGPRNLEPYAGKCPFCQAPCPLPRSVHDKERRIEPQPAVYDECVSHFWGIIPTVSIWPARWWPRDAMNW